MREPIRYGPKNNYGASEPKEEPKKMNVEQFDKHLHQLIYAAGGEDKPIMKEIYVLHEAYRELYHRDLYQRSIQEEMTPRQKIDQALKILSDVFDSSAGTDVYPWLEKHYRPMQHDRFRLGYDEQEEGPSND